MSKDYVIVNIETNGYFDIDDNKQIIFIEALKIDKNMKKKDEFNRQLLDIKNEKDVLCEFIDFCFNSKIIIYNAKEGLSFLLKELYKNNIMSNFKFKYIDMIDLLKKKEKDIGLLIISNIKKYYNIKCDNEIECIFDIINMEV